MIVDPAKLEQLRGVDLKASAQRTLCKKSFFYFLQTFWSTVIAEEPVYNWHIQYICDELQAIAERVKDRQPALFDYVIINVPPGSSKSTIASIMYPVWCWTIDPTQRFICSSYSSDISEDLSGKARRLLNSDLFKKLFHDVGVIKDSLSHIENDKGGERYTTSTGGSVTGKHAHQIIVDDPQNPKKASSEAERKQAEDHIFQTLSTRKVDKELTPTIIIMQRLHESDVTGVVLAKPGLRVHHICLPAELSPSVRPAALANRYQDGLFDPVRMSPTVLQQMRAVLGSYGYAGQFQQIPSPAEGGVFKKSWFEVVDRAKPAGATVHFRLDTAYTNKQKNDPTAILAYYRHNHEIYILDCQSVRLEFPELCKFIVSYAANMGADHRSKLKIEPKASGKSVVQELRRTTRLNVMEDRPPKDDKVTRANSASPKCEAQRVKLHRGQWNEDFLTELAAFPNAAHDDKVDVLVATVHDELGQEVRGITRRN
jgi:predicted phage terminase large subunit-like protein